MPDFYDKIKNKDAPNFIADQVYNITSAIGTSDDLAETCVKLISVKRQVVEAIADVEYVQPKSTLVSLWYMKKFNTAAYNKFAEQNNRHLIKLEKVARRIDTLSMQMLHTSYAPGVTLSASFKKLNKIHPKLAERFLKLDTTEGRASAQEASKLFRQNLENQKLLKKVKIARVHSNS